MIEPSKTPLTVALMRDPLDSNDLSAWRALAEKLELCLSDVTSRAEISENHAKTLQGTLDGLSPELQAQRDLLGRVREARVWLDAVHDELEDASDIADGEDGRPRPNFAMRLLMDLDLALGRLPK
jgi:hypothetical protein